MNAPDRQPVAFISHHSSQVETARRLKALLAQNGIAGWMAPDDIDPGRPFDQAIVEQVRASDLIILLFCSKSDQSRHVKRELMMAEDNQKLIYPVRLEEKAAEGLAYWLNDYQWIDWFDGNNDDPIKRMIMTIKQQATVKDGGATTQPAPPMTPTPTPAAPIPPAQPAASSAGGGFKSWAIPLASAAIVGLIMLAGFYMMTRDDGDTPAETASEESGTDESGEEASAAPQAETSAPQQTEQRLPEPVPQTATSDGYYVVLGSYPLGNPQANARAADFERCAGMAPMVGPSDGYPGFRPGLTVVVIGPYADSGIANEALNRSRSCVSDAYLRRTE